MNQTFFITLISLYKIKSKHILELARAATHSTLSPIINVHFVVAN